MASTWNEQPVSKIFALNVFSDFPRLSCRRLMWHLTIYLCLFDTRFISCTWLCDFIICCLVWNVCYLSRMWWTITGNFGNILPIDWSKTYTRQLHTKVLNLGEKRVSARTFYQIDNYVADYTSILAKSGSFSLRTFIHLAVSSLCFYVRWYFSFF